MPELDALGYFVKLGIDAELNAGDKLAITIEPLIYGVDFFVQLGVEAKLNADSRFVITDIQTADDGTVTYYVDVVAAENTTEASLLTPAVIIAAIIGVASLLTTITVYKIVNSPGAEALSTTSKAASISLVAVAVIVIVIVLGPALAGRLK